MRHMRVVLAALLLPCPLLAAASDFTTRCEREMKPVLEVRAHETDFDLINVINSRVLNTRVSDGSASNLTLGMTSGTHRTEITLDAPGLRDSRSGKECVSPRIDVDLAYKPLQVYVAREFHQQSCAYRTVYAHEMRHVKVYRDNLPLLERRVREALEQRYGNKPLYIPVKAGLAQLESDVDTWLRPFIKELLADVERQQAALDTYQETQLLSHACLGEVEQAMGSSF
jgi:hypothetical protein